MENAIQKNKFKKLFYIKFIKLIVRTDNSIKKSESQEDNEKKIINLNDTNKYYKKVVKPSEAELKLHKEYLKNNLKKNFFN